ncbi:MAG TPA: PEFG-CTERM sorting domain-containing protein [Candidatus Nitrosotenuis sp.]|nr:PEFG-CTERM sorting domain-containing protein [Candidatus Nitrosotenuis sp.]
MKTIAIGSLFAIIAMVAIAPSAFADHMTVEVSIPAGSSSPGCEKTNECFAPDAVTVDVGGEVTWTNDDSAAHTVTSGDIEGGPDGKFNSDLFLAGKKFSHKFDEAGEFPYFCQVHPWMKGTVTVQASAEGEQPAGEHAETGEHMEGEGYAMTMTTDGSVNVKVGSAKPTANEELALDVDFTDADGKAISHVNYDITATQDGNEVLTMSGEHTHTGNANYKTSKLGSDSPVDVKIKILGIGLPDDQANWKSPKDETVSVQVVPEFGQVAMMILAVSIVSIVAVTARSKVIPRL